MNLHLRTAAALALPLAALVAAPAAQATPGETSTFQGVLAECSSGDDLVADFTTRSTGRTFDDGHETVHLRLGGTITRTGTGVVGRYSENQNDTFGADGSQRYSGVLSHLVLRGGKGYTWAGHAVLPADGDPTTTPGLAPLMDSDFAAVVCDALSR